MSKAPALCLVSALSLGLFAACSSDSSPGNAPAGCDEGQILDGRGECINTCSNDSMCDPGYECNLATGLCIPLSVSCTTNGDCPMGFECNSFGECAAIIPGNPCDPAMCASGLCDPVTDTCVPDGCNPADCPPNFVCSATDNTCVPEPGFCEVNEQCNFGERCDEGRCISRAGDVVQTCETAGDCGLGMTCQLGVCIGCLTDLQCFPDGECVFGTCVIAELPAGAECLEATCPSGEQCNLLTGVCELVCTSDADCGMDQTCAPVLNQCIDYSPCTSDADCGPGLTCPGGLGVCVGCSIDDDCPSGTRCAASACIPDITAIDPCADAMCQMDELCDGQDGSCYPADGTCSGDADCRAGQDCNFLSLCAGCAVDTDCRPDQTCVFGTCVPIDI